MTRDVPVVLAGYGQVGQAYAALLAERADRLARRYGVRLRLTAVRGRETECRIDGGPPPPRQRWAPAGPIDETLRGAAVLAQAMPSTPALAGTALEDALRALAAGAHVVTATKSHLLTGWSRLDRLARHNGRAIRISAATGAALPAADLARVSMAGIDVAAVRGCPNGTSTFLLDRLAAGDSLRHALEHAQQRGIAEADPSADLSGADAARKLTLISALLWGWDPADVRVTAEPLTESATQRALDAAAAGTRLRQVASARYDDTARIRVELVVLPTTDPLGALDGPEKGMVFDCGQAGEITVSGGRSSPYGAALAMLKDTLDVARDPHPGF